MSLTTLNSNQFDELIYDKCESAIVMFSRESCGVCQQLLPTLNEFKSNIKNCSLYYIDVEKNESLLQRFSLKGVPQLLFFCDGEYKGRLIGNVSDEEIREKLIQLSMQ